MKQHHTYESYILAFGPHPDDAEVWCGWAIAKAIKEWKRCIIIDLTIAEMSTHGDTMTRMAESKKSAEILWVERDNLLLCDACIQDTIELRKIIATQVRKFKPEIILFPWDHDRHPDHENASHLIKNAVFYAWLNNIWIDEYPAHKPRLLLHYMIWHRFEPDIILPLTQDEYETKIQAWNAYESQHTTNSRWEEYLRARHIVHGHDIWCEYGEWYKVYSHNTWVWSFDELQNGFF
jgi:bacillithiol biosynthesis deacetylase BshB1